MCILVVKPKGVKISKRVLKTCFENNSDGAGYAFPVGGKVEIRKGFFEFERFYSDYVRHEEKACLIHFRIRTHGKISKENCHPFRLKSDLVFGHNGVIPGFRSDLEKSDTVQFNELILTPLLRRNSIQSPEIEFLLSKSIGHSKLAFLDAKGEFAIINENLGEWNKGSWFSNDSYVDWKRFYRKNSVQDWKNDSYYEGFRTFEEEEDLRLENLRKIYNL